MIRSALEKVLGLFAAPARDSRRAEPHRRSPEVEMGGELNRLLWRGQPQRVPRVKRPDLRLH